MAGFWEGVLDVVGNLSVQVGQAIQGGDKNAPPTDLPATITENSSSKISPLFIIGGLALLAYLFMRKK